MEKVENTKYDNIEVPDGLETRLSSKIDQWAKAEQQERVRISRNHPSYGPTSQLWMRAAVAAAVVAIIVTVAVIIKPQNSALADTYNDSKQAYIKTVNTLNMLSETLSMGKEEIEALDLLASPSDSIICPTFKVLTE